MSFDSTLFLVMQVKLLQVDPKHKKIIVLPQNQDDIYTLYLTIEPNDVIVSKTTRRIQRPSDESTRPDKTTRETVTLGVKAETIDLAGLADALRIKGIIVEGPEDKVDFGSYHTLSPKIGEPITIKKARWDQDTLTRLKQAEKNTFLKPILVVSMDQDEVAVALIRMHSTTILFETRSAVPRKIHSVQQYQQGLNEFFKQIVTLLEEAKKKFDPEVIIVSGPGFVKEQFKEYVKQKSPELFQLLQITNTSTSGRVGISEVISQGLPEKFAETQRAAREAKIVEQVFYHLGRDDGLVTYGYSQIEKATSYGAVDQLLILDKLLASSIEERQKWEKLMKTVEEMRGKVMIISSFHEAGKRLEGIGGSAALLRFKLPDEM